jgi:hypothetical protein
MNQTADAALLAEQDGRAVRKGCCGPVKVKKKI